MRTSDKTLMEQLKITHREIERRQEYLDLSEEDCRVLVSMRPHVADNIDGIVERFYKNLLPFDEMDRVIGDAETLQRLKNHLRSYILTLFDGQYDEEYVHSRLRVGVVHRRIGVEPKFYVSAVFKLIAILREVLFTVNQNKCGICCSSLAAIEKILLFDLSLTFDTYIHSLMEDVKRSKDQLEDYAQSLEEQVADRTKLLRLQARHDGLTNLLNQQAFYEELRRELLRGQRMDYSTVLVYFDLDGFKKINDTAGHKRGDEILLAVADAMRKTLRSMDFLARYGGDEFCIIMPESSLGAAEQACNRLCAAMKKGFTEGSGVACSIGIAISSSEKIYDADTLVKKADSAMYKAKLQSGFSICIASD